MPIEITSTKPVHSARDRLLDAAGKLFAVHGFHAIGLRDLASYLGLHAGSLYHHIENKQSLLFELIESGLSDLLLDTERRMKGARSTRERLRAFIQAFVAFHFNEKHKLVLITHEFGNLNEEQKAHLIQLKDRYSAVLRPIIAADYSVQGNVCGDHCLMTSTIITILFGQSQWYSIATTKPQLTEALTNIITGIIVQNKNAQPPATLRKIT
ncbi:TetR/AcrR family transcriptional regulator [Pseudomonas moorei]|uniref:DNA-binding transcriptional regulator, AcrR family n=1 Tax=Pseudomonas moorei TaxID=395599 RepID=A0A1H1GTP2_9PSED|nr:TetR/AcrR family transcriptional regulator [Pseudomonas moorei]KAB0506958.1 TetR/AcrR family transcriptional regulator [Pseudomonas moorei]SDR16226.1 DNA-binding transcriptional regulator, AcrR family [Pseudomonas moorei]